MYNGTFGLVGDFDVKEISEISEIRDISLY